MKIGVLGGTFDPIHLGHTFIAGKIAQVFGLNQVIFMVSKFPPHKQAQGISSAFHRHAMVVLGTMNESRFCASTLELTRQGLSYTVDTLEELGSGHPDDQFCFIAGTDSLSELHLWYEYDKLLSRHCLIFVQRPGAEVDLDNLKIPSNLRDSIQFVETDKPPVIQKGRSFCVNLNAPPISSTEIRQMIESGRRPPQEFLSSMVYEYIRKYRLYEENPNLTEESLRGNRRQKG